MNSEELKEALDLHKMLDFELFTVADTAVTVLSVIQFLVIVFAVWVFSSLLQRALARAARSRGVERQGTLAAIRRLLHYVVMTIGIGIALEVIGIRMSTLFAAGAVFAIGLGFAMQNITQNFVSGVILLLERSIKPGDVLEIEGRMVRVSRMGIRATHARTLDDEEVIMPNAAIVQSNVTNYTLADTEFRLRVTVGVAYSSDMKRVRQALEAAAAAVDWRLRSREPVVLLSGFGASSVDWEISVWVADPWKRQTYRSRLNEAIWYALQEAGITIAFPQLDVHFDTGAVSLSGSR